ncbi:hypothetical protein FOPG_19306 [Fusarium oxysporum f. sp. conglutinans race 2 54008]|uniref:Uncharacterized protein n=1 Tax=Fusarium oxysporum f. sp. conglutinans race 2 54008 TaxID=1089457 RepID=X0GX04_FUSOX|nr:hypothetical protein FOPG_19306 [Fusarium oxysporum f. sp. conglutinans race 2 54008]EXL64431.1 hypothetical protein FOPG_19306 [Fusarium oxysporum f. sp. conglutinans race 2 54008]
MVRRLQPFYQIVQGHQMYLVMDAEAAMTVTLQVLLQVFAPSCNKSRPWLKRKVMGPTA